MLALLMSMSLVHGLSMAIMPALFDEIKHDLGLTHSQIGLLWGAIALGGLLTSIPGGMLGDRFGIKRVIAAGLLFAAITTALRAIFPSFWGLTTSMLLFGMSLGIIMPNTGKAVGMWFSSRELGTALGLTTVQGAAGWGIALMAGASLSSALGGWQNVMWVAAAISFVAVFVWLALARERPVTAIDHATGELSAWGKLKTVSRNRDLWLVALMGMFIMGAAVANVGMLPQTLSERGMSSSMAGMYVAISTFAVAGASIIGPFLSDRVGLRKLFIWPFLLICVATVTFLGVTMGAILIILIIVYSIGLGTALPLFRALILENERIGSHLAGSAFGLIETISQCGGIWAPIAMGAIIDTTGEYWPGFLFLAVMYTAGVATALAIKETGRRARKATLPRH